MRSISCFGNHPEDRYFAHQLGSHLDALEAEGAALETLAEDYKARVLDSESAFFQFDYNHEFSYHNPHIMRQLLLAVSESRYDDVVEAAKALHSALNDMCASIVRDE